MDGATARFSMLSRRDRRISTRNEVQDADAMWCIASKRGWTDAFLDRLTSSRSAQLRPHYQALPLSGSASRRRR